VGTVGKGGGIGSRGKFMRRRRREEQGGKENFMRFLSRGDGKYTNLLK